MFVDVRPDLPFRPHPHPSRAVPPALSCSVPFNPPDDDGHDDDSRHAEQRRPPDYPSHNSGPGSACRLSRRPITTHARSIVCQELELDPVDPVVRVFRELARSEREISIFDRGSPPPSPNGTPPRLGPQGTYMPLSCYLCYAYRSLPWPSAASRPPCPPRE